MSDKIWCAMCGKHGDHGSGACPQLAGSKKVDEFTEARIIKSVLEDGITDDREPPVNRDSEVILLALDFYSKARSGTAGGLETKDLAARLRNI